ncbi:valine--tRNA ligase [candidate division KSB1 bacterium]
MTVNIEKKYDPKTIEKRLYESWMKNNHFHAEVDENKKPFCIMIPPPNVTGILHMGHALQSTVQDSLIRYHRMMGKSSLWMPGTDHAGIATQNVVANKLRDDGIDPESLGREDFIKEVWKWKEKHGDIIKEQQMQIGSSCDWERERFTMDEGLSLAVRTVFVKLYEQGLIYKGKYIVNWCPYHKTAISDEEVKHHESDGSLWYVNYPIEGEESYITVATTRPETILGDTAVAVNPKDKRYAGLIGKNAVLPVLNRVIPIITDDFVDPKFGTGAVKVTPAHDPNDFQMGLRNDLPHVVVIDESGKMTTETGEMFVGLDRYDCRKKLVSELEKMGLLVKIEDHKHNVGKCHRCSTVIEPLLSEQWFLKMAPLAEKAIKAVKNGDITFHPKKWEKDYFIWMENIRDWCISRQLWWGHRIPVWYCKDCKDLTVSVEPPGKCSKCESEDIYQDKDVLDTWFSSWLWPFSTLDWPKENKLMDYFYPTSVLVSGYDILFFWIARMVMAGLWFTNKIPFSDIYITGLIKDELGRIMSKSLGNGIDPLEMVDKFGADAVRYSLVSLCTEGQDIKLSQQKFEMGRNFANKIWNAYRFLKLKESEIKTDLIKDDQDFISDEISDKWIISKLNSTWETVNEKFSKYKLNEALNAIYNFLWHDFCDWYVEILKNRLLVNQKDADKSLVYIALPVFKKVMELLHPFMPYITEEIWQNINGNNEKSIMVEFPGNPSKNLIDKKSEEQMNILQHVIYSIRNIKGEMNIPASKKAEAAIKCENPEAAVIIQNNLDYIYRLGGVSELKISPDMIKPKQSVTAVSTDMEIYVPLAGLINIDDEKKRLEKEFNRLQGQIKGIRTKLSNSEFLKKAPEHVVSYEKQKLESFLINFEKLKKNLQALEA